MPDTKTEANHPLENVQEKVKSRQERCDEFEQTGNEFMKEGNWTEAVKAFTKCVKLDLAREAIYTNRALCYLELDNELAADHDFTEVLKLNPNHLVALRERWRMRADMNLWDDALVDLKKLVAVGPKDVRNEEECAKLQAILDKMGRFKEKITDETVERRRTSSDEDEGPLAQIPEEDPDYVSPPVELTEEDRSPIDTPFEFGWYWTNVHPNYNIQAYKRILDRVPSEDIIKLVSNKINDHMIMVFMKIAILLLKGSDCAETVARAHAMLDKLSQVQRFEMAAMFLSSDNNKHSGELFQLLEAALQRHPEVVGWTSEQLDDLKAKYMT